VRLREQVRQLTIVARDQASALAELTNDCPPSAPSLAIIFWLYGPTRWHEKQWPAIATKLRFLISDIGDLPAMKLSPIVWSEHLSRRRLQPNPRTGKPICDFVLNTYLGRVKEMMNWAVANKIIKYSPIASVKPLKATCRRETWLPPPDVDRLLEATTQLVDRRLPEGDDNGVREKVMRAFVLCLHDSMLRFSEAQMLRRDRIREDGRVELSSRETKGNKRRTIYLTPRTLEAIADLPAPDPGNPFVFADPDPPHPLAKNQNEKSRPVHQRRLHYWFRRLCELAGVDSRAAPGDVRVRPQDLRASGATTADEHGARPNAIRDALGHSFIATTQIYLRSEQAGNSLSVAKVIASVTDVRRGPKKAPRKKVSQRSHFSVASKLDR
jgi:integrase